MKKDPCPQDEKRCELLELITCFGYITLMEMIQALESDGDELVFLLKRKIINPIHIEVVEKFWTRVGMIKGAMEEEIARRDLNDSAELGRILLEEHCGDGKSAGELRRSCLEQVAS